MKLAIIGANEFQNRLILKAKDLGIETHVFAWEEGAIGKKNSDFFYPISIVEKEKILEKCKEIKIDGICSIASDLAMPTVNYIAKTLNLVGNSIKCTEITTNKYKMRKALSNNKILCPFFKLIRSLNDIQNENFKFPLIIKPTDRSGSRGIYKVEKIEDLEKAILNAQKESLTSEVILEEFINGEEYSVESISQNGIHKILQITKKYTTGAPHFIETGHEEPANLEDKIIKKIEEVVIKSLQALEIENGASHTELKIYQEEIKIIEIGARMGGDFIGSDLVELSTGIDFLKYVIEVSLGKKIIFPEKIKNEGIGVVKFIFNYEDLKKIDSLSLNEKKYIKELVVKEQFKNVVDSSTRNGYCIFATKNQEEMKKIKEVIL